MTETTLTSREAFTRNALASAAAIEARRTPAERAADPTATEQGRLDAADEALALARAAYQATLRDVLGKTNLSSDGRQAAFYYRPTDELRVAELREQTAAVVRNAVHSEVAANGRARQAAAEAAE